MGFLFRNEGPATSSICDIYFDNGPLGDGAVYWITSIDNSSPGVSFDAWAAPRNLPGGKAVSFDTTWGLSLDSNSPTQPNGINPGEYLGVSLWASSYEDVLDQLKNGTLRIGVHAQGFDGGYSESYVNGSIAIIPVPASLLLGCVGIGVARILQARKFGI